MNLHIDNTFIHELPADKVTTNNRRVVKDACFSYVNPLVPSKTELVHVSKSFGLSLGLEPSDFESPDFLNLLSGSTIYPNTSPYAMNYGGHQFGHWAGQLGDGRAINLFEILDNKQQRQTLQLKGAGETPYSRSADGLAVLRSSIREHLCSEAMHALGVPTTRSLALMLSGDMVTRDMFYNGNPKDEKGAIVCRVAPTFIRFGNFEILTARGEIDNLRLLADYTIRHFYPEIKSEGVEKYVDFFRAVADNTRIMIIDWQRVGFVHGVMNTDNMSILGLTIDYGPYGWQDNVDFDWTPNTTDASTKRYRFGQQPEIAFWNLVQLANTLYPLINDVKPLEEVIEYYHHKYHTQYELMRHTKIGVAKVTDASLAILDELEKLLHVAETDMTIFYRNLANLNTDDNAQDAFSHVMDAFYQPEMGEAVKQRWLAWFESYLQHLVKQHLADTLRRRIMNANNPKYVLRNYMAQMAIDAAEKGDYSVLNELYTVLQHPYDEQEAYEKWFAKRPDWAREKVGCSMLSCSS